MPTVDPQDIIAIQDAAKEYGKSREWLDKQIAERRLSVVKVPGDVKVYLLRSEIEEITAPYIEKPRQENTG